MSHSLCIETACSNTTDRGNLCYSCITKRYKKKHPFRYCYNTLKQNSKRRKVEFNISFEQFKKFSIKTEYFRKKGRSGISYTIDRINPMIGYEIDNLQILTNRENVQKQHYIDVYFTHSGRHFTTVKKKNNENRKIDNCPF